MRRFVILFAVFVFVAGCENPDVSEEAKKMGLAAALNDGCKKPKVLSADVITHNTDLVGVSCNGKTVYYACGPYCDDCLYTCKKMGGRNK